MESDFVGCTWTRALLVRLGLPPVHPARQTIAERFYNERVLLYSYPRFLLLRMLAKMTGPSFNSLRVATLAWPDLG